MSISDTYSAIDSKLTDYLGAYHLYLDSSYCISDPNNNAGKCLEFPILQALDTSLSQYITKTSYPDVSNNYNQIHTQFEKTAQLRNDLDKRTQTLNKNPKSIDVQNYLETSIFAGVVWTVLASGIVYYTFIEM